MFWLLQTLGWLVCVVYSTIPSFWFLIHPHADYWRARQRSPYLVLVPIWAGMWALLAVITAPWRHVVFYLALWTWIPAILLFAIGFWLYAQSGKHFDAKQLRGEPEITLNHPGQRLVTTGIRARVRHPVYLAHLCELLAWSIGTGFVVCYVLTAFAVLTGAVMIRMEDAELERRFGDEYREYRAAVPGVLPRIL